MARKKNAASAEGEVHGNPKREAVQKAMEALGNKAEAADMAAYIKDNFNLDIENKVIGIHRHHLLRAKRKKAAASAGPRKAAKTGGGDVGFSEILQVKGLVQRYGAKRIRDVIDLLS